MQLWSRWSLLCVALYCLCAVGCRQKQGAPGARRGASAARKPALPSPYKVISRDLQAGYRLLPINRSLPLDRPIEAYVAPFRLRLKATMGQVLAQIPRALVREKPESLLGNLVSDIALAHLRKLKIPVDVFITNLGGIRNDLAAGRVTMGAIYECLPFENVLVTIQVTGTQLAAIFDHLASRGGEPIAGARFQILRSKEKATGIKIGGRALKPKAIYSIGTSDYVARTGFLKPFVTGLKMEKTSLLLRDSVIWGLRRKHFLRRMRKDKRISYLP